MSDFIKRVIGEKDDFTVENVKMPFFGLIFSPFNYFIDNLKGFFLSAAIYSVVLTIAACALGTFFLCGVEGARENIFCSSSDLSSISYLAIKGFIMLLFCIFFYELLSKRAFSWKNLFVLNHRMFKLFIAFFVAFLLILLPIISFYTLYVREPNPDWLIEISFFAFVSIGFFSPFLILRFFSVFGLIVEEREIPSLIALWRRSADNMFKIITSIFFIMAFLLVLVMNFYYNFVGYTAENFAVVLLIEFFYNIIFFLLVSLFVGHVKAQTFYLFGEIED
ncbi:MAG: hypothetical protein ACK5N8_02435 [Alphaproteobacteria bacterium]